ncbi:hydroxymethylglutaryl-CoA lyase [Amycolatopsis sp. SID8362]|uniref:hydroxymethylglutaryl-CoA lyase n=1 Tax=Amycolatopsis sp. SID8362 TaxID=2690346 RepID=UPI001369D154|nr:hydroxymethylglutaryl-CoA lyase [Amycolatopsis sp. SID8362]NBH05187.1 hydroxymethylglutaryl-CoA lyase [Amycolatopsis sp. SID8362]NED41887.1 hydroxymethylglutaryl-CoA lyase [Amycolatopsis sp. SID8362]
MSDAVTLCECFARDGLQHEPEFVPTATKVALLDSFADAGFRRIEATSYSHPGRVPGFSDASDVLAKIRRRPGVGFKATCPNPRAVRRALADLDAGHGADELSLLVSASESHTERNLRTSRAGQWERVTEMAELAGGRFKLVGVVSVAFGCPFEGAVDPGRVAEDVARFADLGADLVTLGDTTGVATPPSVRALFKRLDSDVPVVAHFHNTRGTGIANAVAALDAGCRNFDTAMGGVGGHPSAISYGAGLTGNVCTEDLVSLFAAMGVETGIDLDLLAKASAACEAALGRPLHSMVARAGFTPTPNQENP